MQGSSAIDILGVCVCAVLQQGVGQVELAAGERQVQGQAASVVQGVDL